MGWFRKLKATLRPRGLDNALDDELRFHIEQRTEDFIAQGMGPEEARREALRLFGNRTALRESTRERDMLVWLETGVQDVRYALRGMRRRPGFAGAAVLSLALGIGANTALFSLLDALLLKSAPVENPRALVKIREGETFGFSHRAFEELQTRVRSFAGVTATEPVFGVVNITERGEPRTAFLQVAAGSYFDVLGVPAWQGRVFHQAGVNSPDGAIAVISEQYWRSHYGASPSALGAHFQFLDKDFTVVGIAPPGFRGMFLDFPADVWVPLEQMPKHDAAYLERARALLVLARLRPGVTAARAAAEVSGVLGKKITVAPGGNGYSMLRTTYAEPLTVVECVAGLVLLIACANLANLMLAGAAARQSELAIRQAIGASRTRLVRQWLTESLVVSLCGAALALVVAAWLSRALLRFLPPTAAPALGSLSFRLDFRVLGFAAGLAIFTCLLFGLAPALRAARIAPARGLRMASGNWSSRALVVCQVALCTILLTGSGLFLRTLANLRARESGYVREHMLVASTVPIRGVRRQQTARAEEELRARAAAIPGVRVAGYSDLGVLSGFGIGYNVLGEGEVRAPAQDRGSFRLLVSNGFFAAMGTPLLAGRDFTAEDDAGNAPVAVVNQAFVREFLPPGNPIGRRFRTDENSPPAEFEIVGVVKDTLLANMRLDPMATYYLPYRGRTRGTMTLAIRSAGDLGPIASALERLAREIDPRWSLRDVAPFTEIEDRSLVVERLVAQTSAAFGALSVLVASIGLYGLLALGVARRTKEIGLRIALGASRSGVHWMVVREALALLAIGVAVGLPCASAAARYVATMLYGLRPGDAGNMAVTALAMTAVAAAAALIPAARAARVDPMIALRCD
jgi:predicted permease